MTNGFLRAPQVEELTGLDIRTITRLEKMGIFPQRQKLTDRAVGWREDMIRIWIEARSKIKVTDLTLNIKAPT